MLSAFSYSRKWMEEQWETRKRKIGFFCYFKWRRLRSFRPSKLNETVGDLFFLGRVEMPSSSGLPSKCQHCSNRLPIHDIRLYPSIVIICLWMNTKECIRRASSFRSWGNWIEIIFRRKSVQRRHKYQIFKSSIEGLWCAYVVHDISGLCFRHWMIAKRNRLFHEYFMNVFMSLLDARKKYKLWGFVNKSSGLKGKSNPTEKVFKALSELAAQRGHFQSN